MRLAMILPLPGERAGVRGNFCGHRLSTHSGRYFTTAARNLGTEVIESISQVFIDATNRANLLIFHAAIALTNQLTDGGPSTAPELPTGVAGVSFVGAIGFRAEFSVPVV